MSVLLLFCGSFGKQEITLLSGDVLDKGGSDVVWVCEDAQELGEAEQNRARLNKTGRSKPTGRVGGPDGKKRSRTFATPLQTRAT
jgi:hypothetical protein